MVARGSSTGLTTQDLNGIRTTLASGRKPKVVFTEAAGQIAGQAGQVVALRDPADDEWVVVRFGRDELPFAPVDLAVPPRGSAKRTPTRRSTPAEPRGAAGPPPAARPSADSTHERAAGRRDPAPAPGEADAHHPVVHRGHGRVDHTDDAGSTSSTGSAGRGARE